jgi:acyl carrier protein
MREKILALASEALGCSAEESTTLELDSLEFVDFIREIEQTFAVKIPDDRFAYINTAGDAIREVSALAADHVCG